ncbi:MAG: hypothetical protein KBT39_06445 [Bacteroidales bacterium]|nr:hypothetical protein [Bacteroidales bacterium]
MKFLPIALATLFIICACEKIEPLEEGDNKGKNEQETPGDSIPTITEDTVVVAKGEEFPKPFSLWNGHVVVDTFMYDNSVDILLLAKNEEDRYSAANPEKPNDAWVYANSYSEYGMTGWELPDTSTARYLRDNCNLDTHLIEFNSLVAQTIVPTKNYGKENARYLCYSDTATLKADYTFAFVAGSDVRPAGKSSRYRVRLVKWITLMKEQ